MSCETDNCIDDLYVDTGHDFSITILKNEVAVGDISEDEVRFMIKKNKDDTDAEAALNEAGDVATAGATSIVWFRITAPDVEPGAYWAEVYWIPDGSGGKNYLVHQEKINIKERLAD